MKVTVHIGFEQDDLKRLDAWGKQRRLTRGAAIMTLLDMAESPDPEPQASDRKVILDEEAWP